MYQVIDQQQGYIVDSEHKDFDDALVRALELAEEQADWEGINAEDIDIYENGVICPRQYPDGDWYAGACPQDDDGAYWPVVKWSSDI